MLAPFEAALNGHEWVGAAGGLTWNDATKGWE
jgi:hypothetical protein